MGTVASFSEARLGCNVLMTSDDFSLPHLTTDVSVWFDKNIYTVWENDEAVRVCLRTSRETYTYGHLTLTVTAKESSPPSAVGMSRQEHLSSSLAP